MQSFFQHEKRKSHFKNEETLLLDSAEYVCTFKQITLRQLDRIFALTAITLKEFDHDQFLFPDLFFFLIYLKVCFPSLFEAISYLKLSIGELVKEIEAIIPSKMASDVTHKGNYDANHFIYTIAELLVTYSNEERINEVLVFKDPEERLTFKTEKNRCKAVAAMHQAL